MTDETSRHPIARQATGMSPVSAPVSSAASAEDAVRIISSLVVVGLGAYAAYYVATHPPLRRATWRLLKFGAGSVLPRYLWREVTSAWASTGNGRTPEIMGG